MVLTCRPGLLMGLGLPRDTGRKSEGCPRGPRPSPQHSARRGDRHSGLHVPAGSTRDAGPSRDHRQAAGPPRVRAPPASRKGRLRSPDSGSNARARGAGLGSADPPRLPRSLHGGGLGRGPTPRAPRAGLGSAEAGCSGHSRPSPPLDLAERKQAGAAASPRAYLPGAQPEDWHLGAGVENKVLGHDCATQTRDLNRNRLSRLRAPLNSPCGRSTGACDWRQTARKSRLIGCACQGGRPPAAFPDDPPQCSSR